jgi:hypothetical protein
MPDSRIPFIPERALDGDGTDDFGGMIAYLSVRPLPCTISPCIFDYFLLFLGACLSPPCPLALARLPLSLHARNPVPT